MTVDRRSVALGLRDGVPIAVAVIPFGAIVGLGAVQAGLDKLQAILMPYLVFAGASRPTSSSRWGRRCSSSWRPRR
jgi:predicted branched-subunit amino acid permease